MTEEYFASLQDYAVSPDREESLSSAERRLQSLQNLTMSNASRARKRKRKLAGDAARRMTEAERVMREQERILAEREMRREMSERNREDAAALELAIAREQRASAMALPDENGETEIDIDIPTGDEPAEPEQKQTSPGSNKKPKKTKKTKKTNKQTAAARSAKSAKKTESGTAKGGRFTTAQSSGSSRKSENRITTGGAITLGILTGVLIGTVIYGRVQINEIYTKISALQTEYDDLTAKNVSMRSEMEGKMTVKNIQDYAENVLGLRPLNQSQITYIQLQTEDEVVISEPEENFFVRINDKLVGIWEFLRGK